MAILQVIYSIFNPTLMNWWTISLALFVLILWKFKNSKYFPYYTRKLPPGPTMIPLLGFIPGLVSASLSAPWWVEQSKKFKSKIISIRLFGGALVVINDYDLLKEYFVHSSQFADRQDFSFTTTCDSDYRGIISISGREWKVQRRFTMRLMKDLGMGKIMGEDNITMESQKAIDALAKLGTNGIAFDPQPILNMAVSNVINAIVFGKQFSYDDDKFVTSLQAMNEWFREMTNPANLLSYLPIVRDILIPKFMARLHRLYNTFSSFVIDEIKEHEKNFNGEVKDLIDAYLVEMRDSEDKDVFTSKRLRYLIMDLFLAGSETTYSTLRWFLIYMAAYPDVQEKIYQELNHAIGDRHPSMQDKKNTPYTEAVMCEIQRFRPLIPLTIAHTNIKDEVKLGEYILPANIGIFGNIHQVHRDPRFWKTPDEFDPSNFLDNDGNMRISDKLIPFSIGRRACAGEALARMELYIFFTSWVKTFRIKLETDNTIPDLSYGKLGINTPKPYKIRMILRKQN